MSTYGNPFKRICKAVSFILILLPLFFSCSFISFEKLHISSNISDYGDSLSEPYVRIDFSIEPIRHTIEEITVLKNTNKAVQTDFIWSGNSLYIKPHTEWENGVFYSLSMDGRAEMQDGRSYKVFFNTYFYYGGNTNYLKLQSYEPEKESTVQNQTPIVLYFNKSVNRNSFYESFNIKPSLAYSVLFEENDTKITITPNNPWPVNTVYVWSIKNLKAEDSYPLYPADEYRFFTPINIEHPYILDVCPVTKISNGFHFETGTDIDSHIRRKDAIGFIFSKQPDYDSLVSAFGIEPSLKGYIIPDTADAKRYIYIPQENYTIKERYRIKVSTVLTDTFGLPMVNTFEKFFTSADVFLSVSEIKINNISVPFGPKDTAPITDIVMHSPSLIISIRFSTALSDTPAVIKALSLTPVFPATADSPVIRYVSWDPTDTQTEITWENYSYNGQGIDNFYTLTIPGTKSGITNGLGDYMEDTVCAHIRFPKQ